MPLIIDCFTTVTSLPRKSVNNEDISVGEFTFIGIVFVGLSSIASGLNGLVYIGIVGGHVTGMNWNAMDYAHVNQRILSTYKVLVSCLSWVFWKSLN